MPKNKKTTKSEDYQPFEVDLEKPLTDLAGNPVPGGRAKEQSDEDKAAGKPIEFEDLTLKDVIIEGLSMPEQGNIDAVEKMKRWQLARKVYESKKMSFTGEQVVLIKEMVNKRYASPLVVAEVTEALDPASVPKE